MASNKNPLYTRELRLRNIIAYRGVQPSAELIRSVVKKCGFRFPRMFEIVHGMTKGTISKYISRERGFPPVYWHIFYEFDHLEEFYTNFKPKKKKIKKPKVENIAPQVITQTNKNIIDAIRSRVTK